MVGRVNRDMEMARPLYFAKLRRARAAWVFDLGPVRLIFITIVLISVTSLLYLTQASRVAATGYDISSAEEQLTRLERDEVIQAGLGPIYPEFLQLKRKEWNDYHRQVTPWEIDQYLTLF